MVIDLSAAGMLCPVGFSVSTACAAMRAGIANFGELPYWDRDNLPVVGATIPNLSLDLQFGPRLIEMLTLTLRDGLRGAPKSAWGNVPLLIGVAEPGRPGGGGEAHQGMIDQVQERLGIDFHPNFSVVIAKGHTAGFECLRTARGLLESSDVSGCLVCGVDSYINASSLFWLDQHWRLKREGHTDGVIPGEAAAMVYVRRADSLGPEARVKVAGLGFGTEKVSVFSEEPLLGQGLAIAGKQALAEAGWGFHELDFRLSDVTGENYGFREHALAEARLARIVRSESQPLWHPADAIGDTGAAAGVIHLATAAMAMLSGYAPGRRVGCFTSSVIGDRAVAALQYSEV